MDKKSTRLENKKIYYNFARELQHITSENLTSVVKKYTHEKIVWNGPAPYEIQQGIDIHIKDFWEPFIQAFPDVEKTPQIMVAGEDTEGRGWVSSTGYYKCTFANDWLDIPHTGRPMFIKYGEWVRIEDKKIIESFTLLDIIDVMRIAGIEVVFPWWGGREIDLGPATQDGLWIRDYTEEEAQATLAINAAMGDGLLSYDFENLSSMHQEDFWDVDRMIWAGTGGIGLTRGLRGFENYHQIPWLKAFPDRCTHGPLQDVPSFAEANYSVGGCWSSGDNTFATHTGGDLLGMGATGKPMKLRDYDWYRIENGKIVENWCMIDLIHLMDQLGINLFDRMKKLIGKGDSNNYGGR